MAEEKEHPKEFKASTTWLTAFKKRFRLSCRTKSNQSQTAPEDCQEQAAAFGEKVRAKAKELGVSEIWNADQTPVNFEMIPRKTLDATGCKTVWVRCAGKDKERVSVMLLASSSGKKKKPCIVYKQTVPTSAEGLKENRDKRQGFGPRIWKYLPGSRQPSS